MSNRGTVGTTTLEWIRHRYEGTVTKCPACGHVDAEGNWTSQTNGREIVYHHVCPSCDDDRKHTFTL